MRRFGYSRRMPRGYTAGQSLRKRRITQKKQRGTQGHIRLTRRRDDRVIITHATIYTTSHCSNIQRTLLRNATNSRHKCLAVGPQFASSRIPAMRGAMPPTRCLWGSSNEAHDNHLSTDWTRPPSDIQRADQHEQPKSDYTNHQLQRRHKDTSTTPLYSHLPPP